MHIHLAHLVKNPEYDGDAPAELVHDCLLDDFGRGICEAHAARA